MTKKRILVYGDSNVWGDQGFAPDGSRLGRFEAEQQWPNILQHLLGDEYEVIQDGLCGRIAGNCETDKPYRNGRIGYEIALRSAGQIDHVVVALGGNDLKKQYGLTRRQIIDNLLWYDEYVKSYTLENQSAYYGTIYVGIANIRPNRWIDVPKQEISEINDGLRQVGKTVLVPTNLEHGVDGTHYSLADHNVVARTVCEKIREVV